MIEDIFGLNRDWTWTIIRYLMFRSKILEDTTLIKGQMGVVIMFCSYSRFANKPKFEQLADELMEYVLHIPKEMPLGMDGLCGIGWGITYLYRHEYEQGSPDELLKPLDELITSRGEYKSQEENDIRTYFNYRSGNDESEKVIINQIWNYWNYEYTKNHTSDMGQP